MPHRIDKSLFIEELREEFDNKVDGTNGTLSWEQITDKPQLADSSWRSPVATVIDLPTIGNINEDVRLVLDTNDVYSWNNTEWVLIGANDANIEWTHIQNKPTEFTPETHTHTESEITDFGNYADAGHNHTLTSLSEKSYNSLTDVPSDFTPKPHNHTEAEVTDLDKYTKLEVDTALSNKSNTTHNHTLSSLTEKSYNSLTDVPTEFSPESHSHTEIEITDLDKYTQLEVDTALSGKSDTGHTHDGRYYKKAEVDGKLSNKENSFTKNTAFNKDFGTTMGTVSEGNHGHTESDISDLGNYSEVGHGHTESDISDLGNYADANHNHTLNSLSEKSYNSLTDIPSEFTPSTHNHAKSEITDFSHSHTIGDLPVATSGASSNTQIVRADDSRLSDARAPVAHTHTEANITDLDKYTKAQIDAMMSEAGNGDMLKATYDTNNSGVVDVAESVAWDNVTSKPTEFMPTAHTHTLSNITDNGNLAVINTNGSTNNYLRGDGSWVTPPNTTYAEISTAEIDTGTASALRTITGRRIKYAIDNASKYHVGTTAPTNTNLFWVDTN